jgi:hypothetical protein
MRASLAALAFFLPQLTAAQTTSAASVAPVPVPPVVAADANVVQPERVALGRFVRSLSFVKDGQERRVGTIRETVTDQGQGSDATLIRVQEIAMGPRTVLDTAVSRRTSLAPIWHSSVSPMGTMHLDFSGTRVTGSRSAAAGAAPIAIHHTVAVPTFDSNNQELVMGALPLAIGYAARLPMYIYERQGIAWCDLRVREDGLFAGEAVWIVDASFADAKGTYWIAKQTGLTLQYEMSTPSGAILRATLVKE